MKHLTRTGRKAAAPGRSAHAGRGRSAKAFAPGKDPLEGRVLTRCLREIYRQYPDQWVLIECRKMNKELRVVEGTVVAHADSREEIYKRLMEFRDQDIAIEYTGAFPDNIAIVF